MKCLLLVAHGDRREASHEEVERIKRHRNFTCDCIEVAFWGPAEPSVADAVPALTDATAAGR